MNDTRSEFRKDRNKVPTTARRLLGFLSRTMSSFLVLLLCAFLIITVKWMIDGRSVGFVENQRSARTYFALFPMRYADQEGMELLRQRVGQTIAGVVVRDGERVDQVRFRLEALNEGDFVLAGTPEQLQKLLLELPAQKREQLLGSVVRIGTKVLNEDAVSADVFIPVQERIWKEISISGLSVEDSNIVYQLLEHTVQATNVVDNELTGILRRDVTKSLRPVERALKTGEVIVDSGQIVTRQIARILRAQGYAESLFPWKQIVIVALLLLFWPFWVSLQRQRKAFAAQEEQLIPFIVSIHVVNWMTEYISGFFFVEGMGILVTTGLAFATLHGGLAAQVVLISSLLSAVVVYGFSTPNIVLLVFIGGVSASVAYVTFRDIQSRSHLWRQLFFLGVSQAVAGVLLRWGFSLSLSGNTLVAYAGASAMWSTVVIALLPLLEVLFDVLSPLRLVELSHPSNPLLKSLQIEAPGTYHHSITVGTLAEIAADRLGMNANLVKAGAYYHDIGKIRRPQFFVENQLSDENVHDGLAPSLSALIIVAHVREGLELAKIHGLPTMIKHFIAEHHGTTCLSYFFRKSKAKGEKLPREQFCYPGPLPASRETALLMIADSVEAAVRAEVKNISGVQDIDKIISEVISSKMADGQLDEVDFTLRDLSTIKEALLSTLQSMYHTRKVREIRSALTSVEK